MHEGKVGRTEEGCKIGKNESSSMTTAWKCNEIIESFFLRGKIDEKTRLRRDECKMESWQLSTFVGRKAADCNYSYAKSIDF
jgi:hypothetical protein